MRCAATGSEIRPDIMITRPRNVWRQQELIYASTYVSRYISASLYIRNVLKASIIDAGVEYCDKFICTRIMVLEVSAGSLALQPRENQPTNSHPQLTNLAKAL